MKSFVHFGACLTVALFASLALSESEASTPVRCASLFAQPVLSLPDSLILQKASNENLEEIRKFVSKVRTELGVDPEVTADHRSVFSDLKNLDLSYNETNGRFFIIRGSADSPSGPNILGTGAYIKIRKDVCELKKFYLDQSLRGQGIGQILLIHLIRTARDDGFKKMILQTNSQMTSAIGLYKKQGFKELRRRGQAPIRAAYYSLDLTSQ
jgi:ribosomal protein S18 acetylase RimI-like enzyme